MLRRPHGTQGITSWHPSRECETSGFEQRLAQRHVGFLGHSTRDQGSNHDMQRYCRRPPSSRCSRRGTGSGKRKSKPRRKALAPLPGAPAAQDSAGAWVHDGRPQISKFRCRPREIQGLGRGFPGAGNSPATPASKPNPGRVVARLVAPSQELVAGRRSNIIRTRCGLGWRGHANGRPVRSWDPGMVCTGRMKCWFGLYGMRNRQGPWPRPY